jgi:cell division septation protein DedD
MEDQTSWRGHSFTLLIFGGVVVLCSIFFILGMLVGRTQMTALVASASTETEEAAVDPDLTFDEDVENDEPSPLEAGAVPASPPPAPPTPTPNVDAAITLQIAALSNAAQAEKLRAEIQALGLRVFVLRPAPDDASALHRVQVGPFSDQAEALRVRDRLRAEGYQPILRN